MKQETEKLIYIAQQQALKTNSVVEKKSIEKVISITWMVSSCSVLAQKQSRKKPNNLVKMRYWHQVQYQVEKIRENFKLP